MQRTCEDYSCLCDRLANSKCNSMLLPGKLTLLVVPKPLLLGERIISNHPQHQRLNAVRASKWVSFGESSVRKMFSPAASSRRTRAKSSWRDDRETSRSLTNTKFALKLCLANSNQTSRLQPIPDMLVVLSWTPGHHRYRQKRSLLTASNDSFNDCCVNSLWCFVGFVRVAILLGRKC